MPSVSLVRYAVAVALVAAALPTSALARVESAPVVSERTRATLVAEGAAAPGAPLPIALRLQLKPGWHTYWRNPGDAGEPAALTLRIAGREIKGPHLWPVPERIELAGIVSYGHHGDVMLVTLVPMPASMPDSGSLRIEAEATWLVCEKVCVPEQGRLALDLPMAAGAAPAKADEAAPLQPPTLPPAAGLFARSGQGWQLRLPAAALGSAGASIVEAHFFPERGDLIDHSAAQVLHQPAGELVLDLPAAPMPADPPSELRGVLALTQQLTDGSRQTRHVAVGARLAADAR